jgi:hypothetical protein
MMEKNVSDEIDVYDLLVGTVRVIKKNSWLFITLIVLGIGISFLSEYRKPQVIEGRMIVFSDIVPTPYCKLIAGALDNLVRERSLDTLANRLHLSLSEAAQIESITSEIADAKKDSLFIVSVKVRDRQTLPKLQDGIINYLQNQRFLKIRIEQRKKFYRDLIETVDKGIKAMDSLRRKYFQGKPVNANGLSSSPDPGINVERIIKLQKDLLTYKNDLALADGVQIVSRLSTFQKPERPTVQTALVGFLGGVFTSFLFLGIRWIIRLKT